MGVFQTWLEGTLAAQDLVIGGLGSKALVQKDETYGHGSKPMVPFWGRCTTHFGLILVAIWTRSSSWI